MPSVSQDKMALDWLADNPTAPQAPAVAAKLGVSKPDVEAWKWANDNPADMRAIQVRNKVYDMVAESRPSQMDEQGGAMKDVAGISVPVDRLVVKNLLDNDPEAQKAYFEKKGFKTRVTTSGDLTVKAPGETYYKAIDPQGIDRWDAADLLSDGLSGLAVGSSAEKATGPIGLLVGSATGALAAGGTELAKETVAKLAGLRNGYNVPEIAKQAAIGAVVPPALDLIGGALKFGGKQLGKAVTALTGSGLKPDAAEIEAASEAIGAKATPGQLFEGEVVKKLEDTQRQKAGLLGGMGLRSQIDTNVKAAKAAAEDLVSEATAKTSKEVGDEIGAKLTDAIATRLAPAEAIYNKYETELKNVPVDAEMLPDIFKTVKADNELNPDVHAAISRFESVVGNVKTLDDVKKLGTNVGNAARVADSNGNWPLAKGLRDLQSEIRDARSQAIVNHFDEVPGLGDIVKQEITGADNIYRSTIADLSNVVGKDISKGSPKKEVAAFLDKTAAVDRADAIFKSGDPDQIAKLQQTFPELFDLARTSKLADLAQRSAIKGEIDPVKLSKAISTLEPESKNMIFGVDGAKKADNLKTYLDSLPGKLVGPSGTPEGLRWHDLMNLFNPLFYLSQATSLGLPSLSHIYTAAPLGKDILTKAGKGLQTGIAKGAAVGALNLLPDRSQLNP